MATRKGGYARITRPICPHFPGWFFRSAWEHETAHWLEGLWEHGIITAFQYETNRLPLTAKNTGNGMILPDFALCLPLVPQQILPAFDLIWQRKHTHIRGGIFVYLEVKGRMNKPGGWLDTFTPAQWKYLDEHDADSRIKLQRFDKRGATPLFVLGGKEYEAITKSSCTAWQSAA